MEGKTDIGHDVTIEPFRIEENGPLVGIIETHLDPQGQPCAGSIYFEDAVFPGPNWNMQKWQVLSANPLTLSPSILCSRCGHHGFIRDGEWIPA